MRWGLFGDYFSISLYPPQSTLRQTKTASSLIYAHLLAVNTYHRIRSAEAHTPV